MADEQLDRAVLAACAAVDPAGHWQEDWASAWVGSGAGHPLPIEHPRRDLRLTVDQAVLAALLALNKKCDGERPAVPAEQRIIDRMTHNERSITDNKLTKD